MDENTLRIQADFDRIAPFEGDGWTHNQHYTPYLLQHVPAHCHTALEIGCGVGSLARTLASHSDSVLALDLSPVMIRTAQEHSTEFDNIDYQVADVMTYPLPENHFDAILSVATLHHMDFKSILQKLKTALAPGGVLAILDLYKSATITDYVGDVLAVGWHMAMRVKHRAKSESQRAEAARAAWDEHGKHDSYLTLKQVRQISAAVIPGAVVRRHLLWRYSLIWKKPDL